MIIIPSSLNKAAFALLGTIIMAGGANAAPETSRAQESLRNEEFAKCLSENGIEIIAEEGDAVSLRIMDAPDTSSRREEESGTVDAGEALPLPNASEETVVPPSGGSADWRACLSESASRE